ncbi:hypothetical protein M758_1G124700 [Ceratodon purpureus]|nr:hypothetical protein M758_1G124700 [Ceratodon purpureus]
MELEVPGGGQWSLGTGGAKVQTLQGSGGGDINGSHLGLTEVGGMPEMATDREKIALRRRRAEGYRSRGAWPWRESGAGLAMVKSHSQARQQAKATAASLCLFCHATPLLFVAGNRIPVSIPSIATQLITMLISIASLH